MKEILVTLFLILCGFLDTSAQVFTLVNEEVGIDHVFNQTGFTGGGAAFFDADNDGDDDLYITSGNSLDHFYINNGDGTFTDKAIEAGFFLTSDLYTTSVTVGDVNNDGYQDLFVCTRGNVYEPFSKNLLYINQHDGTFEDVWDQILSIDKSYSMGATLVDYDSDGLLDLYVINYIDEAEFVFDQNTGEIIAYNHTCFDNLLYKNIDGISFERQSLFGAQDGGCSLAVVATDVDLDKDLDLLVANDFGEFVIPNKLYANNNPLQSFTEVSSELGMDQAIYGMGIANGDYDNDGDIDYYITNFGNNLLLENEAGQFSDVAKTLGCDDTWFVQDQYLSISWGCVFADFDNDSFLDLYVGNGWIPSPNFIDSALNQDDVLFMNNKGQSFEQSFTSGISNTDVSRGVCYSDYDKDGDLDVFVVSQTVPSNQGGWTSKLFRNDTPELGNYLQVQLVGSTYNTNAYGSRVEIFAEDNSFVREHISGSSHCSQNSAIMHFGLDTISIVDSIKVDWFYENHKDTTYYNIDVNQLYC